MEKEKPKLDIWHYKDPDLQPRQLLRAKNKRNDAHYFLFDTDAESLTQITNDTLKVRPNRKQKSDFQLGFSNESYAIQSQWSIPWLNDYYLVDTKTGTNQLLKKAVAYPYGLSIQGKYFAYFEPSEKQHYIIDTESKEELCLTCNYTDVDWCEDINGQPHLAGPKKTYGFDKAEQTYFFQSAYDIWAYDIPGKNLHCLTKRKGEK